VKAAMHMFSPSLDEKPLQKTALSFGNKPA